MNLNIFVIKYHFFYFNDFALNSCDYSYCFAFKLDLTFDIDSLAFIQCNGIEYDTPTTEIEKKEMKYYRVNATIEYII